MCARLGIELIVERAEGLGASIPARTSRSGRARLRRDFLERVADRIGADFVALGHHRGRSGRDCADAPDAWRGGGRDGGDGRARAGAADSSDAVAFARRDSRLPGRARDRVRGRFDQFVARRFCATGFAPNCSRCSSASMRRGLAARLVEVAAEMRSLDDLVARDCRARTGRDAPARRRARRVGIRRGESRGASGCDSAVSLRADRDLCAEFRARISRPIRQLILEGGPSDSIDLPGGWRAEREYNLFRLVHSRAERKAAPRSAPPAGFSVAIAADGITVVEAAGFKFEASTIARRVTRRCRDSSFSLVAMFDAAKIADAGLVARNFMKGDRMHPLGMRGTRKVHDVFVDRKLPRASRASASRSSRSAAKSRGCRGLRARTARW